MQNNQQDRKPAVAGSFYPANADQLRQAVTGYLKSGKSDRTEGTIRALVVPHAGYVFSGGVAASGYNQINPDAQYKRVFIIASSHRMSLGKASVYTVGDYVTPLGKLEVDRTVSEQLAKKREFFTDDPSAHIQEHSIEVQLPFLQVRLKKPFTIVPIVVGTQVPAVCEGIAEALKPWFTPDNLFIISSDFSHYPKYADAQTVDAATAKAFCSNSVEQFLNTLQANEKLRIPDLATSMCAWPSGLILLYLTKNRNDLAFIQIDYKNSGDIQPFGDKTSVVGYNAISISEKTAGQFVLSQKDKDDLISIARKTVDSYVRNRLVPPLEPSAYSESLKTKAGAFVTLKADGKLRGCIGSFEPSEPLFKVVQEMAIASSTQDSRFLPVQARELKEIKIEISVLTPLRKITSISEIQLGKHGIYIKKGYRGGTFLPQVATETGWTLEEFLGHCAEDKAGLGWNGWKDADIYVYEAIIFEEHIPK
ncbi:MAG: AmmeMemoRadiSam system protein B [Bacteroidota bacterium]